MKFDATKPYMVRAIYEWCVDNDFTPFLSVKVYQELNLPQEYIQKNRIVFNISSQAAHDLIISNEQISFMARFNGLSRKLEIPIGAVMGIFAKEINHGISFESDQTDQDSTAITIRNKDQSSSKHLKGHTLQKVKLKVIK